MKLTIEIDPLILKLAIRMVYHSGAIVALTSLTSCVPIG